MIYRLTVIEPFSSLKQGQVLKLAMDVFIEQEKLHKTYLVYDGFAVGKPVER